MQGFDKHGYIITVPTLQFNVLGEPMRSASEFRANFARADSETQKAMITDLFGQYDPKTHNTMAQKIVEQLIRADEILDKLIEMGADDCYILEACIRVESLVESINMKQRKQTLYQAIMEGGHSLPEQEVAQEEITDFNTEDPMNSVIAIRGIGTMSISSALEKVSEMAMDIAKLGAMKDAKNVQDNLPRYMDLLATYNESIQEAYRELAQQRKRGGTASRGIDKDISEDDITDRNKKALQKALMVKNIQALQKKMPMEDDVTVKDLDVDTPSIEELIKKYGVSNEEMMAQVSNGVKHESEHTTDFDVALKIALDHIAERFDYYDMLDKAEHMDEGKKTWMQDGVEMCSKDCCGAPVTECTCGPDCKHCDCYEVNKMNEHCGDPMAHDHAPGRMLLMKLYKKEMECQPGSPEHFEIKQMIDGCRKNIGLEEGVMDYIKDQVAKRKATFSGKKQK
jgi:hypothetical protein